MLIASTLAAVLAVASPEPNARPAAAPLLTGAEEVEIETRDHVKLHASFLLPKSTGQKAPGVLLVHDAGGSRREFDGLAERLQKQGFAVLALDLRGHGKSVGGGYDWAKSDDAQRQSLWAFALRDLEAGASYLTADRRVHSTRLAVVGHGAGAALAARFAVRDENVRAIALLDPPISSLGFAIEDDIADLAGLPTMVAVTAGAQSAGKTLCEAGTEANGGHEFVELSVLRKADTSVLEDKRLPTQVAKWLASQTMPKRGRG